MAVQPPESPIARAAPLLSIITCLRARSVSRVWDHHVWLLQRTIESCLAQTAPDYRIIVVCHEVPDIPQLQGPKVEALSVEFAPPNRNNDEMCADKVLKLTSGVDRALELGAEYVMFADGDDLVSNRIVDFVARNRGRAGWYANSEYFYRYGGRIVRYHKMRARRSGPTVIVRASALRFAHAAADEFWRRQVVADGNERYLEAMESRGPRVCTLAAIGHTKYVDLLESEGLAVDPLPFVASTVILNADSTSNVPPAGGGPEVRGTAERPSWRGRAARMKQAAAGLASLRPLSGKMRSEFSIVAPHLVARGGGDMRPSA